MNLRSSVMIAIVVGCVDASAQDASDQELAQRLANDRTRQSAVAKILASGRRRVPLLLSWARKPPADVDQYQLYIGLADAFGQLQTKEAIPFLIKNISLDRTRPADFAPWLKAPQVIEKTFPAVAALIQIGPEASKALIRAPWERAEAERRLAAIFAVSRIRDQAARGFLASALGQANMERYWAEEGLKLLDAPR